MVDVGYNWDMHVILTHEQADFDALAALLGAYLTQENSIPILPRRVNRNARAFLNLYGADLPFQDPRDLPQESIGMITLVDTQSLITLKGTGAATQVQVIDHHQARPDLPETWQVTIDRTGSCTTLFIEALQEYNPPLSSVQATLLLLGIYEDTGSLTYTSTTPRDIRAAAYLIEQGASLRTAGHYLNPPLSPDQRLVYERLLAAAEWHHIHGQNIVISSASARDMSEEISSIAHKIRDLLDPDALFLFVTTSEGIRLVARSTTDRVNVAAIASRFGGGGHDRAAAALMRTPSGEPPPVEEARKKTLARLQTELLAILPQEIRPSVTIGQIMSRHPRLLSPETSAQDAAQLMQRYGYEGYPVVREGKVIGLLTRRAVDRAISHRLNLPAASLMEAGEITVEPGYAIEQLQQVMTSSGWGQVPVVDPTNGEIIGIVTRTDLLKTLAVETGLPSRQNLAKRLEAVLPPARLKLLKAVAQVASEQHNALYIVGGFVRDLLLDRAGLDFDLVVEGDAIALARRLAQTYGGLTTSHSRFGTAKWDIREVKPRILMGLVSAPEPASTAGNAFYNPADLPDTLDLITARTEFYERPTALPTVEHSSIKLDLHRRDFTINTLALRLDGRHYGELHDYWGGLKDLEQGYVRVMHSISFIDDPTRLLRAVRFEQRFGFEIEMRTLQLMDEARQMLKQVSGDRIRHELNAILAEERAVEMLARLEELNLLSLIHPGLPASISGDYRSEPPDEWELPDATTGMPTSLALAYILWLDNLPGETIRGIADRLKLPASLKATILATAKLKPDLPNLVQAVPSQVVARLETAPLVGLYAIYQTERDPQICDLIRVYLRDWRKQKPSTTGDTLRALGVPPGPVYREILTEIRSAWLDGQIHNLAEEQAFLEQLLAAKTGPEQER
ncbi:MAG TPA: CBS domain-containing protein [Anaerolineaceae bacterium]|nr:CBS domain-containing protein [Anaerolineaceae bacterium]